MYVSFGRVIMGDDETFLCFLLSKKLRVNTTGAKDAMLISEII